MLAGFGTLKDPKLYLTEPSGAVSEWSACAVGRGHKEARKELERGRADLGEWADVSAERAALVAAALEALMTTAEAGGSGVEVAVLSRERLEFVQGDELNGAVARAEEALRGRKEEEKKQREMRGED